MRKHRDIEKKEDLCQLTVFWFLVFTIFVLILSMRIVNEKKKFLIVVVRLRTFFVEYYNWGI